jgi:hypothetical protein
VHEKAVTLNEFEDCDYNIWLWYEWGAQLRGLHLSSNKISDGGMQAFAEAVASGSLRNLTVLRLLTLHGVLLHRSDGFSVYFCGRLLACLKDVCSRVSPTWRHDICWRLPLMNTVSRRLGPFL